MEDSSGGETWKEKQVTEKKICKKKWEEIISGKRESSAVLSSASIFKAKIESKLHIKKKQYRHHWHPLEHFYKNTVNRTVISWY